ncbi:MAG: DUF5591 domain-containing protein, partial [Thermoplasmata archaeon]|nr:DUF5591 domain-containing protein [Thermoplasmata archaeon]
LSKPGALFFSGTETIHHPLVHRYQKRLFTRYQRPHAEVLIELQEPKKPYARFCRDLIRKMERYGVHIVINSPLGPVPMELDEMYPIAQSLSPDNWDLESLEYANVLFEQYCRAFGYGLKLNWPSEKALEILKKYISEEETDMDLLRVKAVADMQFGKGAGIALLDGKTNIIKSKTTGKIRNVLVNERHVLSMRAHDGFFTLKLEGGKVLHEHFDGPRLRVVVAGDSVEFNRDGKNVFAKFVIECDEELRPMDEVLVVDDKDNLVAVGRARMNREEMLSFKKGVAVEVREGNKN